MIQVFAADPTGTPLGTFEGLGPFGTIGKALSSGAAGGAAGLSAVTRAISAIIGVMTVAAGIWFLFQFVIGGFFWITSGGDKAKLHEAHERITNAMIGLIIVVAGWSILALTGQFLGFTDILIPNPENLINQLNISK